MRGRLFGLLLEQGRQIGLSDSHGLGHLNHDTLVEVEFVALVQLVAVFVVGVPEEVASLVVHHDAIVERVELEIAILPAFLLAPDIVGEKTAELSNRRSVLRCGDGRGVRCVSKRGCHRGEIGMKRVKSVVQAIKTTLLSVGDVEAWR